jgi:hypothetical protein
MTFKILQPYDGVHTQQKMQLVIQKLVSDIHSLLHKTLTSWARSMF